MAPMIVETLDKASKVVTVETLRNHVRGLTDLGVKGKLNYVLDLCDGNVMQNTQVAHRVKGIAHTWEW